MRINNIHYRTIWPDPEDRKTIRIIDQRHLPHRFIIEDLTRVSDFARAISEMHVRGAGLIGATTGFAMFRASLEASPRNFEQEMRKSADQIRATRPTAKNLTWAIDRQLTAMKQAESINDKIKISFETACAIADEDASFCKEIGTHGLGIIKKIAARKNGEPVNILTHCNAGWLAFVDYGSATAPVYAAHHAGVKVHVWVDETRPWLQGAKLTAWELKEEGVPHTLIPDNTGGHLMQHNKVDLVIVGTDRTTFTGDVANKIGTYLKALAAHDNNIPFYVALPSSTFDWHLEDGLTIPIEQRSADEVLKISGITDDNRLETIKISPEETNAANYGFDVTPSRLVRGLITERGVVAPNRDAILAMFPEKKVRQEQGI